MNTDKMYAILRDTFDNLTVLSCTKGKEYAGSDDRLANFKRLGADLGMDPRAVLWVYLTKHLDAIRSYLRRGHVLSEPIEGRIDDAILYLVLLKCLDIEKRLQGGSGLPIIPDQPLEGNRGCSGSGGNEAPSGNS